MIQDQLVDYISSQIKLGVSRDAIKAALVGAGWSAVDVEDTLKKVSGGPVAASAAQPMQASRSAVASPASSAASSNAFFAASGSVSKNPEPQTIRVSDLVSASPTASPASANMMKDSSSSPKGGPTSFTATTKSMGKTGKGGRGFIGTLVFSILIIVFAGLSGYLYLQNASLGSQINSVSGASQGVAGQVSSLQAQVQALNASNTALAAQTASLTTNNQDLLTNLSFVALAPSVVSSTVTSTQVTVSGLISAGKPDYILTTNYGVKISIKNSADAGVHAALQPLVGGTALEQVTGMYVPGVAVLTATALNGVPMTAPVVATTTTATATTTTVVAAATSPTASTTTP